MRYGKVKIRTVLLTLMTLFIIVILIRASILWPIVSREKIAIDAIRAIAYAQDNYNNNRLSDQYAGDLTTLEQKGLIDSSLMSEAKSVYYFDLKASSSGRNNEWCWSVTAWPVVYNKTGIRTFYIDESRVIRLQDIGGGPGSCNLPADPD